MNKFIYQVIGFQVILAFHRYHHMGNDVIAHVGKNQPGFDHYKRTIHQVLEIFPVGKVEVGRRRNDLLVIPEKQVLLFGEGFGKKKKRHRVYLPPT